MSDQICVICRTAINAQAHQVRAMGVNYSIEKVYMHVSCFERAVRISQLASDEFRSYNRADCVHTKFST